MQLADGGFENRILQTMRVRHVKQLAELSISSRASRIAASPPIPISSGRVPRDVPSPSKISLKMSGSTALRLATTSMSAMMRLIARQCGAANPITPRSRRPRGLAESASNPVAIVNATNLGDAPPHSGGPLT